MSIRRTLKALGDQVIPKSVAICALSAITGSLMSGGSDLLQIALIASAFGIITGGFNSLNGIVDIEADKISRPERPLPSSRLKTDLAWKFTICLFTSSLLLLVLLLTVEKMPFFAFGLVTIDYVLAIFYSLPPKMKRIGPLANATVGAHHTIFPMLTGWSMFRPPNEAPLTLFIAVFFMGWSVHVIEDFEDMEGDREVGIKTLPLLLGEKRATFTLAVICSLSILTGILNDIYSYRLYWLIAFPQQLLIILVSLKLPKTVDLSEIEKIHNICEALSISTGLTLVIGYVLMG